MPLKENNIDSVGPLSPLPGITKKRTLFGNGLTNNGPEVTDIKFGSISKL